MSCSILSEFKGKIQHTKATVGLLLRARVLRLLTYIFHKFSSLQGPLIRRRRIAMIKTLVTDPEKDSRVVSYPLVVSNNGKTISRQFFIKNKDQTQGKIDFPKIIEQQRNKRLRQEKVQQLLQELRQRKADLEASGSAVELKGVDTPKQEG